MNSAVEVADPDHPARRFAARYKRDLAKPLADVAREAGAADPKQLGQQLALVWDGAAARAVVLNSRETAAQARAIAAILIDNQFDGRRKSTALRRPTRSFSDYSRRRPTLAGATDATVSWTTGYSDRDNAP